MTRTVPGHAGRQVAQASVADEVVVRMRGASAVVGGTTVWSDVSLDVAAGVVHLAAICHAFFEIGLQRSPASLGATRSGVSRFARRVCCVGKRLALPGDLNSHRCCAFQGRRPERNANRRGEQALTLQTADHGVLQTFQLPMILPIRFSGKIVRPKYHLSH